MRIIANDHVEECDNLIFELETLAEIWADALINHGHMAKCVEEQCGRKDTIAKGLLIGMSFCKKEIEALLDKYKNKE